MSKQKFPHKILWLASYPKSGNTWYRAFLTALLGDGEVAINNLDSDGIFSSRHIFDYETDIDSTDLYDYEAKLMIAAVYRNVAAETDKLSIIKVHDAFEVDKEGKNIIPEDVTHSAIYFIRNPLDIAGSLANHMHFSIQEAIEMLNDREASMASQEHNLNSKKQFRQNILDWSSHVESWTLKPGFPVCIVRYEDMLDNTFETFRKTVNFIGWDYTSEQILRAIDASSFNKLSRQEMETGFKEKLRKSPKFFRSGTKGNWENELTPEQVEQITAMHKTNMHRYDYLPGSKK